MLNALCRHRHKAHKTANVLNYLPKSVQPKAKQALQAIWMAPNRQAAESALNLFVATYEAKYPKAAACLVKDRGVLTHLL